MVGAQHGGSWSASVFGGWRQVVTAALASALGAGVLVLPLVAITARPASASVTPTCVGSSFDDAGTNPGNFASTLGVNQALCNGQFELVMQGDGNLVEYDQSAGNPIWSSGTVGHPGNTALFEGLDLQVGTWQSNQNGPQYTGGSSQNGPLPGTLALQSDGNIQIIKPGGFVTWQSGTTNIPYTLLLQGGQSVSSPDGVYRLAMQTDGNLVLYRHFAGQDDVIWQTATSGTGVVAVVQADGNLVVYNQASSKALWSSGSRAYNPSLAVQNDGNLVVYGTNTNGMYAAWSSGTAGILGYGLTTGELLQSGQSIQSPNSQYQLIMGAGGVAVLYQKGAYACPLWTLPGLSSSTSYAFTPGSGSYLDMQTDGNLVLYSQGQGSGAGAQWATGSFGNSGAVVNLGDDGNLVVTSASGAVLWQSGTELTRGALLCSGSVLTEGQSISIPSTSATGGTLIMQDDCNLVLYMGSAAEWSSGTSTNSAGQKGSPLPLPGGNGYYNNCYATMQLDGNLVVYAPDYPNGQIALWSTGTNQSGALTYTPVDPGPWLAIPVLTTTTNPIYYDQPVTYTTVPQLYVTTFTGTILGDPKSITSKKSGGTIANDVLSAVGFVFRYVGAFGLPTPSGLAASAIH